MTGLLSNCHLCSSTHKSFSSPSTIKKRTYSHLLEDIFCFNNILSNIKRFLNQQGLFSPKLYNAVKKYLPLLRVSTIITHLSHCMVSDRKIISHLFNLCKLFNLSEASQESYPTSISPMSLIHRIYLIRFSSVNTDRARLAVQHLFKLIMAQ